MSAFNKKDRFLLISGLMVTQTIGWGTTFSQIGILAQPISADLGIPTSIVFSGATVMYLSSSVSAPYAGRLADHIGGLKLLAPGSLAIAAALVMLSLSSNMTSYLAAWLLFGLVMHIGLITSAYTGVTQAMGAGAARGIGTLSLATGLCSSIFWPISEFGLRFVDWRTLCQIYAVVTVLLCFPIHLWLSSRYGQLRAGGKNSKIAAAPANIQPGAERSGFALQTAIASCGAVITVGFGIAVIEIFQHLGTPREEAVFAGSLIGISYVASRGLVTLWANRLNPVKLAQLVYFALPLSFAPLLICAVMDIALPGWLAVLVTLGFGLPAGIVSILRSTFPLYLFGSAAFGGIFGRQSLAIEMASAFSPAGLSWLIGISVSGAVGALIAVGGLAFLGTSRIGRLTQGPLTAEKSPNKKRLNL
jgi:hypothetical protein